MILTVVLLLSLLFEPAAATGDSLSTSILRDHIGHVVGRSSKEQVIYVNAGRIVATVQYLHPFGDRAVGQFIGNAMRQEISALPCSRADQTVSIFVCATRPKDTASFGHRSDVAQKPSFQRDCATSIPARERAVDAPPVFEFGSPDSDRLAACFASIRDSGSIRLRHDSPPSRSVVFRASHQLVAVGSPDFMRLRLYH